MTTCATSIRILFLAALTALSAWTQFETATVLGTVRDASGAIVADVKVTLENIQTGVLVSRATDGNGAFEFVNVRIGRYKVSAEKQGFSRALAEEFTVTVNARQRVDLIMQVGQVAESVTVTGAVQALETDSSDRGQVVSAQQIVNLPLNGRAYADLALLMPGVRKSGISGSRDASFNVNGLRSSLNNFVVDGVDNNAYGTSNQGFSSQVVQLSPDAVAEFKVQTNNYSAEFGRAGGAVINASIRSGTNEFHGSAWEFLRNTKLNAVGFFKPRENIKPTMVQNQFGASLGGPIKKDKLFFFADYEGYRRVTTELVLTSLPTMEHRSGNLGLPINNPVTGRQYLSGIIPQSDITPFAKKVLAELPAVNRPGLANNFEALPRRADGNNKGDAKVDYYANSRWTAFFRYSHRLLENFEPPSIPGPSGGDANGNVRVLNYQMAGGATWTMSARSVMEFRLGIGKTEGGKFPVFLGQPPASVAYGITGLPEDPRFAGGLYSQGVTGYTAFGQQSSNPQFQNPFVINPKVNWSRLEGRHSLKAGYEYQAVSTEIDDFNPKYGRDNYSSRFSAPASSTNNLYNLADFMFGLRSNYSLNNAVIVNLRQRMHFLYLHDDFKVSRKLTLNIGLRYELATPQWERDNILSNFNQANPSLIQAKSGSLYERTLVNRDRNNFAPRFGFAYTLSPKTVIRSGFGVSYVHFNRLGGENLLSYNLPGIFNVTINQLPSQGPCTAGKAPENCFRTTQEGYPAGLLDPSKVNTATTRTNYIPADTRTTYTMSWHFTVQREIARNTVLDMAFVGNRSNKLVILTDLNEARFNNAGENLSQDARRPIRGFQFIQMAFPSGWANYNSLQVKLERRFAGGFYLLNSFTYAKALDNASGHLEAQNGDNSRVAFSQLRNNKGPSGYDQRLNNTLTFVYDLPFGKGRRYGAAWGGVSDFVLGGWRLTQITTITSGTPVNLNYGPVARQQVSSSATYRPNLIGDPKTPNGEWFNYLNPAMVLIVPTTESNPFGNAGRNSVYGPGLYQTDLGLHKAFPLPKEGWEIEFRAEFFNLTNKTNLSTPNSSRSSNAFGTINSTSPARVTQFALKLVF
ncbi:MAG: TonB-dependent receptor [Acidobacteriia bacterium]|nr:TonB-dependent receptor [Terriglobia bacterium]